MILVSRAEHALKVPVRDHWWQTETGSYILYAGIVNTFISALFNLRAGWPICANMIGLDGIVPVKHGSTFTACPGYDVRVVNEHKELLAAKEFGDIVIKVTFILILYQPC